jgi:tetratricopeptide (TPR) repeat protein
MKLNILLLAMVLSCVCGCVTKPAYQPSQLEIFNEAQNHLQGDLQKIIPAIQEKNFSYLESYYGALIKHYSIFPTEERDLNLAFNLISNTNQNIEAELNQYVDSYPESYTAHLIRGIYFVNRGWNKRGNRFINETNESQINAMNKYFDLALSDIDKAILLNSDDVYANSYKISVLMNFRSRKNEVLESYHRALKSNPLSLTARSFFMSSLEPKWGGSLNQMMALINDSKSYADKNPLLNGLQSRIYTSQGEMEWNNGQLDAALISFKKAVSIEEGMYQAYDLYNIGNILYYQKHYAEALSYFEKAIAARPTSLDSYKYKLLILKMPKAQ